jgi:hypothetical protein
MPYLEDEADPADRKLLLARDSLQSPHGAGLPVRCGTSGRRRTSIAMHQRSFFGAANRRRALGTLAVLPPLCVGSGDGLAAEAYSVQPLFLWNSAGRGGTTIYEAQAMIIKNGSNVLFRCAVRMVVRNNPRQVTTKEGACDRQSYQDAVHPKETVVVGPPQALTPFQSLYNWSVGETGQATFCLWPASPYSGPKPQWSCVDLEMR